MSNEVKSGSVPSLSIGKAVEILGDMYARSINNSVPLKKLPSVMLWGPNANNLSKFSPKKSNKSIKKYKPQEAQKRRENFMQKEN